LNTKQQPLYSWEQKDSHINTSSIMQQSEHKMSPKGDDTLPQT
jgi:hypothetical protein